MTEFIGTFELAHNQQPAGPGFNPNIPVAYVVDSIAFANGTTDPIPHPVIPPSGYGPGNAAQQLTNWLRMVEGYATVGSQAAFSTFDSNSDLWWVDGASVNNGGPPQFERNQFASGGFGAWRTAPNQRLRFAGAALAAISGESAPTGMSLHVQCTYPEMSRYVGQAHFCEWWDTPENNNADVSERLQDLLSQITAGAGRTIIGKGTNDVIVLNDCGFAAPAPEGAVYVTAEDIGSGAAQIPSNMGDNAASHFRFHPSVFLRRTSYVRGVSVPYRDQFAFNQTGVTQPYNIIVVDNPVTQSNWLIMIEGRLQLVQLRTTLDLRRPRDIWEQIWVPLINGSNAVDRAVELAEIPADIAGPGSITVNTSRLRFLEYARCLPLPGTPTTQTGGPT